MNEPAIATRDEVLWMLTEGRHDALERALRAAAKDDADEDLNRELRVSSRTSVAT
jgi:hypothetical protein